VHAAPAPGRALVVPGVLLASVLRALDGIQGLSESDDGELLVSWAGAIRRFAEGRTEIVFPLPASLQPSEGGRLLRDRDGGLWIGTLASGLLHLHQGVGDAFTPADGLSGGSVLRLFEDHEGSIWVVTGEGVDRFRNPAVAKSVASAEPDTQAT